MSELDQLAIQESQRCLDPDATILKMKAYATFNFTI